MKNKNILELSKCNIHKLIHKYKRSCEEPTPNIIHKIWYQGLVNMPIEYKECLQTWIEKYPNTQIWLWDNISIREILKLEYNKLINTYNGYEMIQRIDLGKYMILNTFGGIYTDMDQFCLKRLNVDSVMGESEVIISTLTEKTLLIFITSSFKLLQGPYLNNAFIISKPNAKLWTVVFEQILANSKSLYCTRDVKIICTTGPLFLTNACHKLGFSTLKVLDSYSIDPLNLYFKLNYNVDQRVITYLCKKPETICLSTKQSSWRSVSFYDKILALLVEYMYYDEITEALKAEKESDDFV